MDQVNVHRKPRTLESQDSLASLIQSASGTKLDNVVKRLECRCAGSQKWQITQHKLIKALTPISVKKNANIFKHSAIQSDFRKVSVSCFCMLGETTRELNSYRPTVNRYDMNLRYKDVSKLFSLFEEQQAPINTEFDCTAISSMLKDIDFFDKTQE
jgi:hypothetical protein